MKEIAFFMLPAGAASAALLCVPWQGLQRSCITICNMRISLGRHFSVRLSTAFLMYNLLRFIHICIKLMGGTSVAYARILSVAPFLHSIPFFARLLKPSSLTAATASLPADLASTTKQKYMTAPTAGFYPLALQQEHPLHAVYNVHVQARVLRYQRDFWITLFATFLWLFVCWAAFLLRWYWRVLEKEYESYEDLLQERRRVESVAAAKAATKAARMAAASIANEQGSLHLRTFQKAEAATERGEAATEETAKKKTISGELEGAAGSKVKVRITREVELTRVTSTGEGEAGKEEHEEEEETQAEATEKETTADAAIPRRRKKLSADDSSAIACRSAALD